MKRIGILTFERSVNFGAQLQAYALQNTVKKIGYNAEVINYSMTDDKIIDKMIYNTKLLVKSILLNLYQYKKFKLKYNLSKEKYTDKNILYSNEKYDAFITGSDQVWNPEYCRKTNTYLLGFTNKTKISYAASFGVENIEDELSEKYKLYLSDINYVSIREKQGCKIFKNLTSKLCNLVLDPTLLLTSEEWNMNLNLCSNKNRYVLIYMLEYSKELIYIGRKFARDHGLKCIIISGTPRAWYYRGVQWGMSPQKFVKLFYNSEYVFTNSFHGTAFSINFKKQFYVKLLVKNDKVNNRLTNILSNFNLNERIIKEDTVDNTEINYDEVTKLLDKERQKSIEFLRNALKDSKNEE